LNLFEGRINKIQKIRDKKIKETLLTPFDAKKWQMIARLVKDGKIKTVYISESTCLKMSDINIP
jgi:hypothetical protein